MTDKPAHKLLQPAPRPRPINDPGMMQSLDEVTRDLGFNRPTSTPAAEPAAPPAAAVSAAPAPKPLVVRPEPSPKASKSVRSAPAAAVDDRSTSIKFEIDDALSTALKFEAVRRRVTVKYLILEALAAKDFPVDLANLPEDGRRVRK